MKLVSRKMMSPICFENVAQTHAKVSYSFLRLMIFHFDLKMMSMNLGFPKQHDSWARSIELEISGLVKG